jgi:AhpD family alkylhydroperoxidase
MRRARPAAAPETRRGQDLFRFATHKEDDVQDTVYPTATRELTGRRTQAAPEIHEAFQAFGRQVFTDGALPEKTKQLIAVAVAHVTQCPYCIRGHARLAERRGASEQEIMEAIWVAAEMRAGGAYAHSLLALDALRPPELPEDGAHPTAASADGGHAAR